MARSDGNYQDAACIRGIGSLCNHTTGKKANARFSWGRDGDVNIIATRPIRHGQEILLNYNLGRARAADRYRLNEPHVSHKDMRASKPKKSKH